MAYHAPDEPKRRSKTAAATGAAGLPTGDQKSRIPGNLSRSLNRDAADEVPLGNNQYAGPSSITDVTRTPEMNGLDIKARGAEDVIDIVKAKGMGSNFQLRSISAEPYKTSPGMRNRSGEGGKIPLKTSH